METYSETTPLKSFMIQENQSYPNQTFNLIQFFKKKVEDFRDNKDMILLELKEILAMTVSMTLILGLRLTFPMISLGMNGHLDKYHLDAVALANSFITLTCTGISGGFAYAISTIFGHMFGDETFKKQMGTVLQRAMILFSLFSIFIISIYLNIEPIFLLFGQNPVVSKLSSYYLTVWLPSAVLEILIMLLTRYLLVLNYKLPCMVITLIGLSVNVLGQYILVHVYRLSYLCSAACQTTSYLVMLLLYLVYIRISKVYMSTWEGFRPMKALQQWKQIFKFSVYGAVTNCMHYILVDVSLLCAGVLGIKALSEYGVLYNLYFMFAVVDISLGSVMNIRLSTHLSSKDMKSFCVSYKMSLIIWVVYNSTICIIYMSLRNFLPMIFTNAQDIIDLCSNHMIFLTLMYICCLFSDFTLCIVISSGRLLTTAVVAFVTCVMIGLSSCVAMAFLTDLSAVGLVLGCALGFFLEGFAFCVIAYRTDWQKYTQLCELFGKDKNNDLLQSSHPLESSTESSRCCDLHHSKKLIVKYLVIAFVLSCLVFSIILRWTVYGEICIPQEYSDLVNDLTTSQEMFTLC